jgi:DNA-binding transcriptional regulator YiaG
MTKRPKTGPAVATAAAAFHYTASGLPNVWLLNGFTIEETPYGRGVRIEDADALHKALARAIATAKSAFTGAELRYLRKHLQLSQVGLARMLGCTDQTVARWEKEETTMDPSAERLVRMLVLDKLSDDLVVEEVLEELAELDEAMHGDRHLRREGHAWREAA